MLDVYSFISAANAENSPNSISDSGEVNVQIPHLQISTGGKGEIHLQIHNSISSLRDITADSKNNFKNKTVRCELFLCFSGALTHSLRRLLTSDNTSATASVFQAPQTWRKRLMLTPGHL